MSPTVFAQQLQTPRMWLRCPLPGEGLALYQTLSATLDQLRQWPDSLPWAQEAQSPEQSEAYCQSQYAACVMGWRWPLLMWDSASGQLVGSVGFHHIDPDSHTWELGYWCGRGFQGQGRTSEAVNVLTSHVMQHWPQVRMVCRVDRRNTASERVARKAGFRPTHCEVRVSDSGLQWQIQHYALGR